MPSERDSDLDRRPDTGIEIRHAVPSDADALAELAARTFHDAFAEENTPEDMASHIARNFAADRIRREIADPGIVVLLASTASRQPLTGYAKLVFGSTHGSVRGVAPVELERLYVDLGQHRRGVGSALMRACFDEARRQKCRTIWLGVWERNEKAIAFYERWGFEQVGSHVFRLGSDDQTDLVLARDLHPDA